MLEYTQEENKLKSSSLFYCEVCGTKPTKKAVATIASINEFYKDGTIKIHYTCSNHIVDLYNKIMRDNNRK
jgi:hypothetical protein